MREKTKRVRCQDLFVVMTAWSPLQDVRRQVHLRVCITLTTLFAVAPAPAYKGTQKSKKSGDLPSVVLKLPKTRDKNIGVRAGLAR